MVMDIFEGIPGLPGLFLASLFSASLRSVNCIFIVASQAWSRYHSARLQCGPRYVFTYTILYWLYAEDSSFILNSDRHRKFIM